MLEGEPPDALAALRPRPPRSARRRTSELIWVSVTPFGRTGTRAHEPATDLTLLAGGGPVWSCGYDDHSLPPVRGGGNQAFHIASTFAVHRRAHRGAGARRHRARPARRREHARGGQRDDRSRQLRVAGRPETVQRQTGRHALTTMSMPTQMCCADGRYVTTGFPPRCPARLRGADRLAGDARPARRVSRHRAPRPRRRTRRCHHRRDGHRPAGGRDLRRRPPGADVHRRAHHRRRVLPSAARPAASRAAWSQRRRRRSTRSTSWRAASRSRSSTTTSGAATGTRARPSSCRRRRGASPVARRMWASTTPRSSEADRGPTNRIAPPLDLRRLRPLRDRVPGGGTGRACAS